MKPHIKPCICTTCLFAIEEAREEGKSYWEPSEHHKDVWRKEGYEKGLKDARTGAWYQGYDLGVAAGQRAELEAMIEDLQERAKLIK